MNIISDLASTPLSSSAELSPALLLGMMLLAGILGELLAKKVRIPKVVGFLFAGIAIRQAVGRYLSLDGAELDLLAEPLRPLKDLALGLILFSLGEVFCQYG